MIRSLFVVATAIFLLLLAGAGLAPHDALATCYPVTGPLRVCSD